jgi:hypothetical protein
MSEEEGSKKLYPKMVYPKGPASAGVVVKTVQEEMDLMGVNKEKETKGWGKD